MQEILSERSRDGGCGLAVALAGATHLRCTWLGGGDTSQAGGKTAAHAGPCLRHKACQDLPTCFLLAEGLMEGATESGQEGSREGPLMECHRGAADRGDGETQVWLTIAPSPHPRNAE